MSASQQLNESIPKESPKDMTTFEFYAEKYKNFKTFVKEIASYYPEIIKWSNHLDKMNLAVFISLVEPKTDNFENMSELFLHEMEENGIDTCKIHEEDLRKLHRYADLFTIMLSE
jgi:hypothetical protein